MMYTIITIAAAVFPKPGALPSVDANPSLITTILHLVFGIAAAVAFLIITFAGFQYVISQGDPQKTAKAKNTILYAVIGLVVAISGFAIVSFVIGQVT